MAASESALWRSTMAALFGDDWRAALTGARAADSAPAGPAAGAASSGLAGTAAPAASAPAGPAAAPTTSRFREPAGRDPREYLLGPLTGARPTISRGPASPRVGSRPGAIAPPLALRDSPEAETRSDATGAMSEGSWADKPDVELLGLLSGIPSDGQASGDFVRLAVRAHATLLLRRLSVPEGALEAARLRARIVENLRRSPDGLEAAAETQLQDPAG